MINATILRKESYLICKSDRGIHEPDKSWRGAADGRGAATRQHGKGMQVFKAKLANDSNIDQSGCTALTTCRRHVVNGTHCVGVSVLTKLLHKTHACGGS